MINKQEINDFLEKDFLKLLIKNYGLEKTENLKIINEVIFDFITNTSDKLFVDLISKKKFLVEELFEIIDSNSQIEKYFQKNRDILSIVLGENISNDILENMTGKETFNYLSKVSERHFLNKKGDFICTKSSFNDLLDYKRKNDYNMEILINELYDLFLKKVQPENEIFKQEAKNEFNLYAKRVFRVLSSDNFKIIFTKAFINTYIKFDKNKEEKKGYPIKLINSLDFMLILEMMPIIRLHKLVQDIDMDYLIDFALDIGEYKSAFIFFEMSNTDKYAEQKMIKKIIKRGLEKDLLSNKWDKIINNFHFSNSIKIELKKIIKNDIFNKKLTEYTQKEKILPFEVMNEKFFKIAKYKLNNVIEEKNINNLSFFLSDDFQIFDSNQYYIVMIKTDYPDDLTIEDVSISIIKTILDQNLKNIDKKELSGMFSKTLRTILLEKIMSNENNSDVVIFRKKVKL